MRMLLRYLSWGSPGFLLVPSCSAGKWMQSNNSDVDTTRPYSEPCAGDDRVLPRCARDLAVWTEMSPEYGTLYSARSTPYTSVTAYAVATPAGEQQAYPLSSACPSRAPQIISPSLTAWAAVTYLVRLYKVLECLKIVPLRSPATRLLPRPRSQPLSSAAPRGSLLPGSLTSSTMAIDSSSAVDAPTPEKSTQQPAKKRVSGSS